MKYYAISRIFFSDFYRTNLSVIAILFFLGMMYSIEGAFWSSFYDESYNSTYTTSSIIAYIFCALAMFQVIATSGRTDEISEDIELGNIDVFLLKTVSYISFILMAQLGMIAARLLVVLPILYLCLAYFNYGQIWSKLGLISIFCFICGILNCLINMSLSFLTFFYKDSYGFVVLKETLFWVLSGALIPLNLLPTPLVNLNAYLPFGYTLYYPLHAILNGSEALLLVLVLLKILAWIIIFIVLSNCLWRYGLKKYQSGNA